MLGWTTQVTNKFESLKVLCEHGKVSVYAVDFDGSKTHAYVKTFLTEDCEKIAYADACVARNFEFFANEQCAVIKQTLFEKADKFVEWEYKQSFPTSS